METILYKIAYALQGIAWDDLSTAETQIANLLIEEGYLTDDRDGELKLTGKGKPSN